MSKREIIDVRVDDESLYVMLDSQTPEQVIAYMQSLRKDYGDRYVYFNLRSGYDGVEIELREHREENDKEYGKRLKKEQEAKDAEALAKKSKEDGEFSEYKRLFKKYGKIEF